MALRQLNLVLHAPLDVHTILGLGILHSKVEFIWVTLLCFAFQVL
jgi:hypothetical protein